MEEILGTEMNIKYYIYSFHNTIANLFRIVEAVVAIVRGSFNKSLEKDRKTNYFGQIFKNFST